MHRLQRNLDGKDCKPITVLFFFLFSFHGYYFLILVCYNIETSVGETVSIGWVVNLVRELNWRKYFNDSRQWIFDRRYGKRDARLKFWNMEERRIFIISLSKRKRKKRRIWFEFFCREFSTRDNKVIERERDIEIFWNFETWKKSTFL